jgi:hypothetical protein
MRHAPKGIPTIDAISVVSGVFKCPMTGDEPHVDAEMVYLNMDSGTTFGTCPIKHAQMSPATLKHFENFIESLEIDCMQRLEVAGHISVYGEEQAESGQPLSSTEES